MKFPNIDVEELDLNLHMLKAAYKKQFGWQEGYPEPLWDSIAFCKFDDLHKPYRYEIHVKNPDSHRTDIYPLKPEIWKFLEDLWRSYKAGTMTADEIIAGLKAMST